MLNHGRACQRCDITQLLKMRRRDACFIKGVIAWKPPHICNRFSTRVGQDLGEHSAMYLPFSSVLA